MIRNGKIYYNIQETANRLQVAKRTVRIWVNEGKLPNAFKTGTGRYLVPLQDVKKMYDKRVKQNLISA